MDEREFRTLLRKGMIRLLEPMDSVIGAWEGGSVATGHDDDLSDLDLYVVVRDGAEPVVFDAFENFLSDEYGLAERYILPSAAGRPWSQRFYRLRASPELFYCDICLLPASAGSAGFLERERHGDSPDIWFDKGGTLVLGSVDPEAIRRACGEAYRALAGPAWILTVELRKQVLRGSFLEAYPVYVQLVMKTLVGLLNLKERPARHDFGMRYIDWDYPEKIRGLVESYLSGLTMETITRRSEGLIALVMGLIRELEGIFGGN